MVLVHFQTYAVVSEGPEQVGIQYTCGQPYMHIKGSPDYIHAPAHWNVSAVPPVIAQQYSSTTFFASRFQHRKENFGLRFKMLFLFSSIFLKQLKSVTK